MKPIVRFALAAFAIATLAACSGAAANPSGVASLGSQSPDPESSAEPQASVDPEDAALAFAECMREHGVDMPDPQIGSNGEFRITVNGGPGSMDMEEMQAAQEACQELMPGGGEPRELTAEQKDAMLGFAQCMRDNGIDMPDPEFEGGGMVRIGGGPGSGGNTGTEPAFDPGSDEFQAAAEACRGEFGEFLPGGGPSVDGGPAVDGGSSVETAP